MVAQALQPHGRTDVRLVTEIRGEGSKLFTEEISGEVVYSGPAGTGKTRTLLEAVHRRCQRDRLRVLMIRKTEESLKSSMLVTYREQVLYGFDGKRAALDGVTYFGGNKLLPAHFVYEQTGSVIVTAGLDNVEKVKSSEWDIVLANEATELSLNDWEMITGRTDRPSLFDRPPSLVIGDCNPDAPTHWIKQRAEEGRLTLWTSTHVDNPAMWDRVAQRWTVAGERYLAILDGLTGVRYQRLRHGKWVAAEGQVYESWDDGAHLVDRSKADIRPEWDRVWVLDWGYVNPLVWGCWAIEPDGGAILEHELYRTRTLVADAAHEIMRFWGGRPKPVGVVADHDAEDRATFERETKLTTIAAKKDIQTGIQAVERRLKGEGQGPRLRIVRDALIHHPDPELRAAGKPVCTAQEIPTYVWDERQSATVARRERPVKVDDHGMDMTRYLTMYLDNPPPGLDPTFDYARAFSEGGI
ncbi:phage terminase large subunit [Nocardioides sp.]|uniref:phage terminase large subunit n=1 Tax=Nocardioides sp. TaxID=35761 RepID=UPI002C50D004|nr:phage terminase large subunit [Nocardioides sp.]HXH79538.1 phage terminase large subunit [Nocardioides sp.]